MILIGIPVCSRAIAILRILRFPAGRYTGMTSDTRERGMSVSENENGSFESVSDLKKDAQYRSIARNERTAKQRMSNEISFPKHHRALASLNNEHFLMRTNVVYLRNGSVRWNNFLYKTRSESVQNFIPRDERSIVIRTWKARRNNGGARLDCAAQYPPWLRRPSYLADIIEFAMV